MVGVEAVIHGLSAAFAEHNGKLCVAGDIEKTDKGKDCRVIQFNGGARMRVVAGCVYPLREHIIERREDEQLGLSLNNTYVTSIKPDTPAERSKFPDAVRVEKVNGTRVRSLAEFKTQIAGKQKLTLSVSSVPRETEAQLLQQQQQQQQQRRPNACRQVCSFVAYFTLLFAVLFVVLLGIALTDVDSLSSASTLINSALHASPTGNDGLPELPDYYQTLGLSYHCTTEEVQAAGRSAPLTDRRRIAVEVLQDPPRRKVYDLMGVDTVYHGHFIPQDARPHQRYSLRVSLEDTYRGAEHVFALTRREVLSRAVMRGCQRCRMQPPEMRQVRQGMMVFQQQVRPDCRRACSLDHQVQHTTHDMPISIPRGIKDGEEITLRFAGDHHADRLPGDIIFHVSVQKHRQFSHIGDDVHALLDIPLVEALTGVSTHFTHLDGRALHVQRAEPIEHGGVIVLPGEGMRSRITGRIGDMLVTVQVKMPTLNDHQKLQMIEIMKGIEGEGDLTDLLPVGEEARQRRREAREEEEEDEEDEE